MLASGRAHFLLLISALCSALSFWYSWGNQRHLQLNLQEAHARESRILARLDEAQRQLVTALDEMNFYKQQLRVSAVSATSTALASVATNNNTQSLLTNGYTYSEDGFFVLGMKLWKLDQKSYQLDLPKAVTRVWFDVGTHARAGVTRPFLDTEEDLFIIGFEPNHFQWGEISTTPSDYKAGPNKKDWGNGHPRFWAIQAAASSAQGYATFHRTESNMCSSLNAVDKSIEGTGCGTIAESFTVNVLMLETLLKLIPNHIRVEFVKIDAQGHDLSVAKGMGEQMQRVEHLMLECQIKPLYEGAALKPEVLSWFEGKGWTQTAAEDNGDGDEINLSFSNPLAQDHSRDIKFHRRPAPWLLERHLG